MANQPRKHHYVPQFYLAGFTKNDSKDGALYVLDKTLRRPWKSTPRGSAHKRDFHAIDAGAAGDPMVVEKLLGEQFEGKWSAVLSSVVEKKALPEDEESFAHLMLFVAFMAVRVPSIRGILSNAVDRLSKAELQATLATEAGRAHFRTTLAEGGHTMNDDEFDKLVRFGQSGDYDVDFEQTWHVQQMVSMAATLAPLLSLRKWCLWIAEEDAPDLICSDRPVAPTWASPMPGLISPAFGTPNTIVSVPLNRRIALVSMIEKELPHKRLDRQGVAEVNSMTALYANQLFSSEPDFVWAKEDEQIGNSTDLLNALKEQDGA